MSRVMRNTTFVPDISKEGIFHKPFYIQQSGGPGDSDLEAHDRLYKHQTLNSVRRFAPFEPTKAPKDRLDMVMNSAYSADMLFPDAVDVNFQEDTVNESKSTWKKLRNTVFIQPEKKIPMNHPMSFGGVPQRLHPSSVKLMNSSHHSPQTNAGYVRQDLDGNVFHY